jgi:hypothetical protein
MNLVLLKRPNNKGDVIMKKLFFTTFLLILSISIFSAKYILITNENTNSAEMYNLEKYDKIEVNSDFLTLSMLNTSYKTSDLKISLNNDLELKKYDKVNYMIQNGYIVKPNSDNKYFKSTSAKNLTVSKLKQIKVNAFLEDLIKFMNSNETLFNVNAWTVQWALNIPVDAN